MTEDIISLSKKFEGIKSRGWIEGMRRGTTGIGYTFETLLGKEEEDFPIPDYGSIEIKTKYRNSKYPISLFSAAPDGDYLFGAKRIYDRFAYPQHGDTRFKVFYAEMYGNRDTLAGRNYKFRLIVNRNKEEIRVIASSKKTGIIDTEVSWSFQLLKEKVERKLKYLAIVKADAKNWIEKQYYKYYEIKFYFLKSFDVFLSLIEDGTINVLFDMGCYKAGPKAGMMDNHGAFFRIKESDLEKLYDKI